MIGQTLLALACLMLLFELFCPKKIFAVLQVLFLSSAMGYLCYLYLTSDFRFLQVMLHSNKAEPLIYKIAGLWGSHEGSLLLWCTILSCYGIFVVKDTIASPLMLGIKGAFFTISTFFAHPFDMLTEAAKNGLDLNPVLQDPALIIHPPFLYLGFAGTSVLFVLAAKGLLKECEWDRIRSWCLYTWICLSIGLSLGSFWAYYELGWGGWWFWDPVENLALIPWLLLTATLHLLRSGENKLSLVLAMYSFLCVLLAFCMVRGGLLNSVHNFALDLTRVWLFAIVFIFYFLIANFIAYKSQGFGSISKLFFTGTCLILAQAGVVLFATLVPLFYPVEIASDYFNSTFIPLGWVVLVLASLSMLNYQYLCSIFLLSVYLAWLIGVTSSWGLISIGCAGALMASSIAKRHIPHFGLSIMILGMGFSISLKKEKLVELKIGQIIEIADHKLQLNNLAVLENGNHTALQAKIDVFKNGKYVASLKPEQRFYHAREKWHYESSILHNPWNEIYVNFSNINMVQNKIALQILLKPGINLLWLGILIVILGSLWRFVIARFTKI